VGSRRYGKKRRLTVKRKVFGVVMACAVLGGMAALADLAEVESNDGFATAQSLDPGFSLSADSEIFWDTTYWHSTVLGTNAGSTDVDYYKFSVPTAGVTGFFDIDHGMYGVDTTLALFNAGESLLAYVDDSSPADAGSAHSWDAFLGVYTFASAGTYYIAVSNYANFPLAYGTGVGSLLRPDGYWGGTQLDGSSGPTTVSTGSGYYGAAPYELHASLSAIAIPEPSGLALCVLGLGALVARRTRRAA
jgi:hypothetical protein